MPHKKLQKICYYAVAWHYTLYDSDLVSDTHFEAWVHGPVSPELYQEYKEMGWTDIPKNNSKPLFNEAIEDFLDIVYNTYGDLTGHQLESLTHSEDPWKEARKGYLEYQSSNEIITNENMKRYYSRIYADSQND